MAPLFRGDFLGFSPAAATRCTDRGEISPQSVQGWGCGALITENFTTISAYKLPAGAYPLGDFYLIFIACRQLYVRSGIKISAYWVKGFRSFEGLSVRVTPNFQRPQVAKLCVGGEHVLGVQTRYGPPLSPCQVWWGLDICLSMCLSVCLSVTDTVIRPFRCVRSVFISIRHKQRSLLLLLLLLLRQ